MAGSWGTILNLARGRVLEKRTMRIIIALGMDFRILSLVCLPADLYIWNLPVMSSAAGLKLPHFCLSTPIMGTKSNQLQLSTPNDSVA